MGKIQEENTHNNVLGEMLKQNITQLLSTYKEELQAMLAANQTLPAIPEPENYGRNLSTNLVKKQIMSFSFPETCDLSRLRDINLVFTKLKDWTVETRQRITNKCDTYYRHPTAGVEFRSIREIVNHVLLGEGAELEKRKKTFRKDNQGESSKKKSKTEAEDEEENSKTQLEITDCDEDHALDEILSELPEEHNNAAHEEDIDGTLSDAEIDELLRKFVEKKYSGKTKEVAKKKLNL